ncbi:MAG: sigma-E processing peptidase SpoIIGA [Prevotella sp.]|nr:sigma-E processing peptidase SpoIIGA [Alistipes senegalensis]MCM1357946.1 sigma-E processing peptidase SpoIIGA [Prevotella sp.]MCM1474175.1 sigma-E processing peptidase SpoIIGA [Muribaculaceae bacterium]
MQTIYVDVLIILNIYVNYFLLRITARLTHSPLKFRRCIITAVYGSIYSLLILAPHLNGFINILIKFFAAVTIVVIAFGFQGRKRFIINTAAFFSANFILAGTVYAVYSWLEPEFMHFNNSYFYIDFSLLLLVLTTAVMYFLVYIAENFLYRTPEDTDCYNVIIKYKDTVVTLDGLADTGNSLTDFFSGSPVIVCDRKKFSGIKNNGSIPKGFRLLPCSTISDSGFIEVFRPDEVLIKNNLSGERKKVDAVIGLGENSGNAVFNPKILKI